MSSNVSSLTDSITSALDKLNLSEKKEINVLLLGETGVGKSTFINSIFNYLQFRNFDEAKKKELNVLIPAALTIGDKNGGIHTIRVGERNDDNENLSTGVSATQAVKTYSFRIKNGQTLVRLIDTPGMGDTRGVQTDLENCENILNYIGRLHHLHAILYLLKAQQSRSTVYFQYCVQQILSRLDKSACKNLIFAFTHSRGSNYGPDNTLQLLQNIADNVKATPPHAEIPLEKNIFYFDNETFKALVALKNGIELPAGVYRAGVESWTKSSVQCWNMIKYIADINPHTVQNTCAINEARRIIFQLLKPVTDIAQLINDNIYVLDRHKKNIEQNRHNLNALTARLFIPIINLEVTNLTQPVTVCTEKSCTELYDLGSGRKEWHYKTRCHDPCYLHNVPKEIIGSPELMNCSSMGPSQSCKKCGHSYKLHMHVYYMTKKKNTKKMDPGVSKNITTQQKALEELKKVFQEIENRKKLLENELTTIVTCNAKFAHFLANNAIVPFSDSYEEYINYLKDRERGLGTQCDLMKLAGLERLLREHRELKNVFQESAKAQQKLDAPDLVTPRSIDETKQKLFKLKLNGQKIRQLFESQKKSQTNEYSYTEYIHQTVLQPLAAEESKQDDKKIKNKFKKNDQADENKKSSAANLTTKLQKGRPLNSGKSSQRRSRSSGSQHRSNSPPPVYTENNGPYEQRGSYPPPLMPPSIPPNHQGYPSYHTLPPPPSYFPTTQSLGDYNPQKTGADGSVPIQLTVNIPSYSTHPQELRRDNSYNHSLQTYSSANYPNAPPSGPYYPPPQGQGYQPTPPNYDPRYVPGPSSYNYYPPPMNYAYDPRGPPQAPTTSDQQNRGGHNQRQQKHNRNRSNKGRDGRN